MKRGTRWLAVELLGCQINDQERIYHGLLQPYPEKGSIKKAEKYMVWGASDIMLLWDLDSTSEAREFVEKRHEMNILNRQVYFANFLHENDLSFSEASERLPLIGVSFLKLKSLVSKKLPNELLGIGAYDWIENFLALPGLWGDFIQARS